MRINIYQKYILSIYLIALINTLIIVPYKVVEYSRYDKIRNMDTIEDYFWSDHNKAELSNQVYHVSHIMYAPVLFKCLIITLITLIVFLVFSYKVEPDTNSKEFKKQVLIELFFFILFLITIIITVFGNGKSFFGVYWNVRMTIFWDIAVLYLFRFVVLQAIGLIKYLLK